MTGNKMTPRKEAFVSAYVADVTRNATQAAIKAGYSKKTAKQAAYKLMQNEDIREAIAEAKKELHEQNTAEAEEVVEFLTAVMRGKEVDTVPLSISSGKQKLFDSKASARDRIKAAELLGRYYTIFDGGGKATDSSGGVIIIPEVKDNG